MHDCFVGVGGYYSLPGVKGVGQFPSPLRRSDETFRCEVVQSCVLADAIVVCVHSLTRIVLGVDKCGHCAMKTLPLGIIQLIGVCDRLLDQTAVVHIKAIRACLAERIVHLGPIS